MKQIMTDMGKDSYEELKELSYKKGAWRTAVNRSNDWRLKQEE